MYIVHCGDKLPSFVTVNPVIVPNKLIACQFEIIPYVEYDIAVYINRCHWILLVQVLALYLVELSQWTLQPGRRR